MSKKYHIEVRQKVEGKEGGYDGTIDLLQYRTDELDVTALMQFLVEQARPKPIRIVDLEAQIVNT